MTDNNSTHKVISKFEQNGKNVAITTAVEMDLTKYEAISATSNLAFSTCTSNTTNTKNQSKPVVSEAIP